MIRNQKVNFEIVRQEIGNLKPLFDTYQGQIVAVYLFGSLVSEKVNPLSDIDIAVLFDATLERQIIQQLETRLYFELAKLFQTDEIDLVVLNDAPLSIQFGVLRDKLLLYYSNKLKVVDFENQTTLEFLDFQPYREEFNQEFLNGLN